MAKDFRVIICGGAFGGLTLAMALERYGIDYVLLEAKSSFAPETGATIGLQPRGERILDQLGLWDQVLATKSVIKEITWVDDISTRKSDKTVTLLDHGISPDLLTPKFGYGFIFNRRQKMLQILWSGVQHKEKCLTDKKVTRIEERGDKIVAFCGEEEFIGDVLVGADGVHSIARREMWRIGNGKNPGTFDDKEMTAMGASIRCLYGYSTPADYGADYDRGCFHVAVEPGRGMMCFMGSDKYCQWAVYEKLDRRYKSHEIPRYNQKDAHEFANHMRDVYFTKQTPFGKVVDNTEYMYLAPLEESKFTKYQHGKILCIGDAVHKTTPHIGIGANFAIEAAADAANVIKRYHDGLGTLEAYPDPVHMQAIAEAYKDSYNTTRMMMRSNWVNEVMIRTILQWAPDVVLQWGHLNAIPSVKLDYLPVPQRSVEGWMPFNPKPISDNIWLRMLVALPLFYFHDQLDPRADYVLYVIMLLEMARRINALTFTALPNAILLLCGQWALPVWFWLHFVFSAPMRRFQGSTERTMNMVHLRMVAPVAFVGLRFGFQWAMLLSTAVSFMIKGTVNTDWRNKPFRDVKLTRYTGMVLGGIAAADWWAGEQIWTTPMIGALAWMGLIYLDMTRLSHVKWWQLVLTIAAVPVLGPYGALALAWMNREELLRTSRSATAITSVDSLYARVPESKTGAKVSMNGSANGSAYQNGSAHKKGHQNGHAH